MSAALILICDDEEPLRALVRAALRGYEIAEARDGYESLELARRLRPDLVILDMGMPGRSGLEVLQVLRADAELAAAPVVMLTAKAGAADRAAAAAAGASRFVAKPFRPAELAALVGELLRGR